ncbi:hypothetical protein NMW79_05285 [Pasteurella multocida]|nr:hypothetical protein [Pasteurella multocida]
MDVIQLKENTIREHEQECIKTCNEVQECVDLVIVKIISENKDNKVFNINYADIGCYSVDCCLDQNGDYYYLANISEGDDNNFSLLIRNEVVKKLGIDIRINMEW